jgi:serine/threonine protein kinase
MNPQPNNPESSQEQQGREFTGFTCRYGDRPLQGYTVQRGLGRGGFGEVYYALSDAGREVALKMIQGCEQIELRGVSQCMNLKSPHLVTIFDVRYNDQGRPFVIMEYVSGPSLRDLIDQSAGRGLGPQKAAYFLREIAKGLTYLHEGGIVHRDLKPANVFYEDGYVKIGDYGLSKAIQPGLHSGQTVTVGSVHYMAPEIGDGHYDSSIDIYALGAVLYEMLTGRPPYEGESLGEVLMKHLSGKLDVSGIEEPFASTISKAMAKDPADRFETVEQMVESIFDEQHVRNSVSLFSPNSLSVVAGRVASKVRGGSSATVRLPSQAPSHSDSHGAVPGDETPPRPAGQDIPIQAGPVTIHTSPRRGPEEQTAPPQTAARKVPARWDSLDASQRLLLAGLAVAGISLVFGFVAVEDYLPYGGPSDPQPLRLALYIFGMSAAGIAGVMLGRAILKFPDEGKWLYSIGHGGMASLLIAAGIILTGLSGTLTGAFAGTIAGVCVALMLLVDWRRLEDPNRKERFRLWPALVAGFGAMIFAEMFEGFWHLAMGLAMAVTSGTQIVMPLGRSSRKSIDVTDSLTRRLMQSGVAEAGGQVSPYYRWHCFGLAMLWFAGLGGLHRIYVGKTFSGIVYLLTWGLFGVGQLFDVIRLLSGQFRDGQNRPILLDDDKEAARLSQAVADVQSRKHGRTLAPSVSPSERSILDTILAALAVVLMLATLAAGIASALNVPAMLASGIPDDNTARQMRLAFGDESWPGALNSLVQMTFMVILLLTGVVMMVLRRRSGVAHMARVIVGCFGLLLASESLGVALERIEWQLVSAASQGGMLATAIREFTSRVNGGMAVLASLLLLVSVIIFCWTPRRRQVA